MEPINQFIKNNKKIERNNERIYQELIQNPKIMELINDEENPLTASMIKNDLITLKHYADQPSECKENSEGQCENHPDGYIINIDIRNGRANMFYTPCPIKVRNDEFIKRENLIQSYHVPEDIKNATFDTIYLDDASNRNVLLKKAIQVTDAVASETNYRGLYIHGEFGIGKSYILGCIANELKEKAVSSLIVYVPEILRDLKAGFRDGTTDEKYNLIKNAHVLILDDLGAEDVTPWARDEVITGILHHRMVQKLPTFISSNFSIDDLEYRYARTKENGIEETKARRMTERIRALCEEVQMTGDNYRNS
ncbi:primosomal protein DnaI [Salinicoccus sp. YB14-2]|uniref:primosomal protein DnaI n=1 Tax=Salinicoccus sp. YB14-2 TaxID=1572701 RepID=UPI00068EB823|nr:primosomal protein DnaI [Salinicoccus sp. YB14-2]